MADPTSTTDATLASDVADKSLQSPAETSKAADSLADSAHTNEDAEEEDDDDDDDLEADNAIDSTPGGETATGKKKKKKPKKKKAKAATTDATTTSQPSQPIRPVPASDIPTLLKQLAMDQRSNNRDGKAQSEYKFWNTQPVPKFKEPNLLQTTDGELLPEGPILPTEICKASVKEEPEKLVEGFEWHLVDLEDHEEMHELYDLLENHYVEDHDGRFRFKYSEQFLTWALKPPGWKREWHIGVRARSTQDGKKGKLVAFIAGVPVVLKVRDAKFNSVEINFLTVHRKLRSKRLAPVLIKEITRKCYQNGIFQALYTAGTILPTPVTTCRYYHRALDWGHLYKAGFSHLPPGSSELRMKYKYKVDQNTSIKGLRLMKQADVPAVMDLLVRYLERFQLRQEWTKEEIEHWLCSDVSKGVVWSYVVETNGKITDFMSFYSLEVSMSSPQLTLYLANAISVIDT